MASTLKRDREWERDSIGCVWYRKRERWEFISKWFVCYGNWTLAHWFWFIEYSNELFYSIKHFRISRKLTVCIWLVAIDRQTFVIALANMEMMKVFRPGKMLSCVQTHRRLQEPSGPSSSDSIGFSTQKGFSCWVFVSAHFRMWMRIFKWSFCDAGQFEKWKIWSMRFCHCEWVELIKSTMVFRPQPNQMVDEQLRIISGKICVCDIWDGILIECEICPLLCFGELFQLNNSHHYGNG